MCATRNRREFQQKKPYFTSSKGIFLLALAAATVPTMAMADNFSNIRYDARGDQLIVTMLYRGTNPDHAFTITWGACKDGRNGREIEANVLDSQWQDAAQHNFTKTTHFSLADMNCRPSTLTLRTAPRFYYTLQVPAKNIQAP